MLLHDLKKKKLLGTGDTLCLPPAWLADNCIYLTISGSIAYGCADTNSDEVSDFDTIGIVIPPKVNMFPHLGGYINGFSDSVYMEPYYINSKGAPRSVGVYQEHGCFDKDALSGKGRNYDLNIYNICKFFRECQEGNPNLIDSLFTRQECILHCSQIGNIIRENRKMFFAKSLWKTYKNYAYSQLHKMEGKKPVGKRVKYREEYGFDVKFAYNLVRLISEAEMIFTVGDIDLMQNREQFKAIRRGEWTKQQCREYITQKEKLLEEIYLKSDLPMEPDKTKIQEVLMQCLEVQYQNIGDAVVMPNRAENLITSLKEMIHKAGF